MHPPFRTLGILYGCRGITTAGCYEPDADLRWQGSGCPIGAVGLTIFHIGTVTTFNGDI